MNKMQSITEIFVIYDFVDMYQYRREINRKSCGFNLPEKIKYCFDK